jgi:superfamily I DNA and/or RNA helicase/predicted DNA-binding WGR domain protein
MTNTQETFIGLIRFLKDEGSIKSADFVAFVLPLLQEVQKIHETNEVAYILETEHVAFEQNRLQLNSVPNSLIYENKSLFEKPTSKSGLEVSGQLSSNSNLDDGITTYENLEIHTDVEKPILKPVFLLDYQSWDYKLGHYDPLTDVFILGQYLASVAFGLDFTDKEDLELFVNNRKRLYFLNKQLHPTILNVIYEMTHLYREDRTANLVEVITKLEHYREYNPENYVDLTETEGFRRQDVSERGQWILSKLKNRLFDISRRNKLLYFKERGSFLNLTVSSVPLLLDFQNINENDLLYWNESVQKKVIKQGKLKLNTFLEFEHNRYLAPVVNKIRLEARKNQNEYGFSQLRTVVAFLHWYNFKESTEERITSPLLLLPTSLVKKKGVRDQYDLKYETTEAEINPILSHFLKDLYSIDLPDFIDLETTSIEDLVKSVQAQIAKGGTGIILEWRDKPKIKLVHSIAKRNYNLKSKKLSNRSRGLNLRSFNYSYNQKDFRPLGLQIFNDRIRYQNNALEYIINEDLSPNSAHAVSEKKRTFYETDNRGEVNPYIWEVDTCNVTLGNFNYRKMSLVRDYNQIINAQIKDAIFESLFSDQPRQLASSAESKIALKEFYPIIAADPTQSNAIVRARSGESYIIQGPPGTGKSQTITNLIADFVARGKKVLFVCEKRAALDVVFHRLKDKNLNELCCLIHDSQTDKKAFIQNLKVTYEDFLKNKMDKKSSEDKRQNVIEKIQRELDKLAYFHAQMKKGEQPPFRLFEILHSSKGSELPAAAEIIRYPNFADWVQHEPWIEQWWEQLRLNSLSPFISHYAFNQLSLDVLRSNNPKAKALELIEKSLGEVDAFNEFLDNDVTDAQSKQSLQVWKEQVELARKLENLLVANKLDVFDINSEVAKEFQKKKDNWTKAKRELDKAQSNNENWISKFDAIETEAAISKWNGYSSSIFRFINPGYYKLKKQIKLAYNFSAHAVQPEMSVVLDNLNKEHGAESKVAECSSMLVSGFGLQSLENDLVWIKQFQNSPNEHLKDWIQKGDTASVLELLKHKDQIKSLVDHAEKLFGNTADYSSADLEAKLLKAKEQIGSLAAFLPFIEKGHEVKDSFNYCLFNKDWNRQDFMFNTAYKSLALIYEKERRFESMDADTLEVSVARVNELMSAYYTNNVESIQADIRDRFNDAIRITESTAAQLTPDEKLQKKELLAARRILENEFGKSMRYKSIRELACGPANILMSKLKPVWLMSPLSVSDTMPIDTENFDVVIYDEASQITVEEGVPSLFRTEQTIIVGDEMQMPPTNFFGSSSYNEEEEDEIEDKVGISLDADSLLNQGSRKLSSVMLGWHYRSRHESLISFSNAAFYQRSLLTIPDSKVKGLVVEDLEPIADIEQDVNTNSILSRSISFHYLENAVYVKRSNKDEARYIAKMVAKLLLGKSEKSIGVVAFSMQQQGEIEAALEKLSDEIEGFETILEEAYSRVDDDQFNGLFVKNLENVQGDERDIIIMSVCYGANEKGRMLMNFGPINRRGGEKRLNVIFSRAKHHMVVVTSILPQDIKNDYNEGANYFKRFLSYSKAISDGRWEDAHTHLDQLHKHESHAELQAKLILLKQLKSALEEKGYEVDEQIGQSHFKCDLAIKKKGDERYALGVLLDKPAYYSNDNILEQYCQKPSVLNAFGWNVCTVYSKDWLERPARVLDKIDQHLAGKHTIKIENNIEETEVEREIDKEADWIKENEEKSDTQEENKKTEDEKVEDVASHDYNAQLVFQSGNSNKYWKIKRIEKKVITHYGRIGNKSQESLKEYDTAEKALQEMEKMIKKKLAKGYKIG